ncbi:hypothetical protein EVAR_96625_1 [Eumeta japonica]|uniref:Uncharacterized protein n=1 Tax=Eumeta variegata TaxID=151549 RepID=A0A4C1WV10_EUMVA|nr:hypothetical protein EVAR_96625_1 [Eumeta japonica]
MTRVIFGAELSPCTAVNVKNANAEKHRESFPAAVIGIIQNHYMDDYLQSFLATEEAIKIARENTTTYLETEHRLGRGGTGQRLQRLNTWLEHLQAPRKLDIPQCYPGCTHAVKRELHTFVDASEHKYAASRYWRTTAAEGSINMSLVMAKARVAPLKITSVPRLELQAAVMGVQLAPCAEEGHDIKPDQRVFWNDSRTVLTWIKTGARAYKPWFRSPEFLQRSEEEWPSETQEIARSSPTREERTHTARDASQIDITQALPDITRFSSWQRLRRTTARALQFVDRCKAKRGLIEGTHAISRKRIQKTDKNDPNWRQTLKKIKKIDKIIYLSANEKKFVSFTLHKRYPREEVFATLLIEAEYTVNSRPLTHVSVSADDPEALTSNHFLLGGPGRVPVPESFRDSDTYGRQQWRHAQRLADLFWTR